MQRSASQDTHLFQKDTVVLSAVSVTVFSTVSQTKGKLQGWSLANFKAIHSVYQASVKAPIGNSPPQMAHTDVCPPNQSKLKSSQAHSRLVHWNLKRVPLWINVLFKGPLFSFHVGFPDCMWLVCEPEPISWRVGPYLGWT